MGGSLGCNALCSKTNTLSQIPPDTQAVCNTRNGASTLAVPHLEQMSLLESFHGAAAIGNSPMLTFYLGENSTVDLMNSKYNEATPLHIAVRNKQYKVMEYLLENQANPNIGDDERGDTPLHIACRQGDLRAVKIICQHQVDTSIENEYEETALTIALQRDTTQHQDIASYLEPNQKIRYKLQQKLHTEPDIRALDTGHAIQMADSVMRTQLSVAGNEWVAGNETARLGAITDDLFDEVQDDFKKKINALGPLTGWLERQQHSPPHSWLKRWVVVQNGFLLWADRHMNIERNVIDRKERKRWSKCMLLTQVKVIKKLKGKNHTQFVMKVNRKKEGPQRYIFRTESKEARDYWVNNFQQHLEFSKAKRNPMLKDKSMEHFHSAKLKRIL